MPEFISSTCPACSISLKIPSKLTRLSCGTCGNEFNVKQEGGIVFLEPVGKELKNIVVNTDKTASELAINRISNDINNINSEIRSQKQKLKLTFHYLLHQWFKENPSEERLGLSKWVWNVLTFISSILASAVANTRDHEPQELWYADEIERLTTKDIHKLLDFLDLQHRGNLSKDDNFKNDTKIYFIIDTLKSVSQLMQKLEDSQTQLNRHKQIVQKL